MDDGKHVDSSRSGGLSALRSPGVYYELFSEKKVQPAFRTGVPVFVGFAKRGHHNVQDVPAVYHLDRWPQLHHFLEPLPGGYLGYAVRGFFENGGETCVVMPLESTGADMGNTLINAFQPGGVLDELED